MNIPTRLRIIEVYQGASETGPSPAVKDRTEQIVASGFTPDGRHYQVRTTTSEVTVTMPIQVIGDTLVYVAFYRWVRQYDHPAEGYWTGLDEQK